MNGYADLPKLVPVMDTLLSYLNVKDRVKFKSVCRSWKAEIERREAKSDTLVLHCGPYLLNVRWNPASGRGLMKYENSFEMRTTSILDHPMTISRLQKIKKLAIVHVCQSLLTPVVGNIQNNMHAYLGHFEQCEEIELKNFLFQCPLVFNLPKLKVLVIDSAVEELALNCPSLEVLCWTSLIPKILFHNLNKLKRLTCFSWPAMATPSKFESLEYLNMIGVRTEILNGRLLSRMPNLKRFVIYSCDPRGDQRAIRKQAKRYGLNDLELLFCGFCDPVKLELRVGTEGFVRIDRCVDQVFAHYSKLVESLPWELRIDYSKLFSAFKILPNDFVERFVGASTIEIREVTNYNHLFGFLQCFPAIQKMRISFSKVNAERVLALVHLLQPSLNELTIVEERPADLLKIDLSFMYLFNLVILNVMSTHIPIEFIHRAAAKRGLYFNMLVFEEIAVPVGASESHQIGIYFEHASPEVILFDRCCGMSTPRFTSLEELLAGAQTNKHFSRFFM